MPGRSTNLNNGRARAYCACSTCGWGLFGYIFSLTYQFSFLSISLWNGWMGNLRWYQDAGWVMGCCMQFRLRLQKFPPQAELESGTASIAGWLVVFWLYGPLRHYFSLYRTVSQREGEREESQNVETIPTPTYCKRNRPLPYYYPD